MVEILGLEGAAAVDSQRHESASRGRCGIATDARYIDDLVEIRRSARAQLCAVGCEQRDMATVDRGKGCLASSVLD